MNSFDLLRLLAAAAVILHHCRPFSGQPPIRFFDLDPGALGVGVFFVISGYLVTGSLQRSAGVGDYVRKRLLRIEPALIVSLLITAFVVGAMVTSLPLGEYLRRPEVYLYVLRNALLYPVTYDLPGVFTHNPIAAVNPSLWTLRLEFTCYLGLAALGVMKLLRLWIVLVLASVAALAVAALTFLWPQAMATDAGRMALVGAQYGFLFLAGAALWLHGRSPPMWALLSASFLITPLWILGLPVAVILLGRLRGPRLPADISYGLYIYACPVQQVLAMSGPVGIWPSLLITTPLAVASWFLIEKPVLRLKTVRAAPAASAP